jgi:hypothetical protein
MTNTQYSHFDLIETAIEIKGGIPMSRACIEMRLVVSRGLASLDALEQRGWHERGYAPKAKHTS